MAPELLGHVDRWPGWRRAQRDQGLRRGGFPPRPAIVGPMDQPHRLGPFERDQQVDALGRRDQHLRQRLRGLEQAAVMRDHRERSSVLACQQQRAPVAGVDQPQPDRGERWPSGPVAAGRWRAPVPALAARPVGGRVRRRLAVDDGQVLEHHDPLVRAASPSAAVARAIDDQRPGEARATAAGPAGDACAGDTRTSRPGPPGSAARRGSGRPGGTDTNDIVAVAARARRAGHENAGWWARPAD